MRRKRIEGLQVYNTTTGIWSQAVLASVMATYDRVQGKLFILGAEFYCDGQDGDYMTLTSTLRDEEGQKVYLRVPHATYMELIDAEGNTTAAV